MGVASPGRRGGDFGDGGASNRVYDAKTCTHVGTEVVLQVKDGTTVMRMRNDGDTPALLWCAKCGSIRSKDSKWVKPQVMKFEGE